MVDVYSDWCGPCAGMQATLKKLKLEVGGDMLHVAMVRLSYTLNKTTFKKHLYRQKAMALLVWKDLETKVNPHGCSFRYCSSLFSFNFFHHSLL